MTIPPEFAWLVPLLAPFIVGLLIGAVVKRTMKLLLVIAALIIVLVATGAISLGFSDVYDKAMEFLPRVIETGQGWLDVLPFSAPAFLIGLALGLWRG